VCFEHLRAPPALPTLPYPPLLRSGVAEEDLRLPPRDGAAALLERELQPVLHLAAARRDGPRADGKDADPHGLLRRAWRAEERERSEETTAELPSPDHPVCSLLPQK